MNSDKKKIALKRAIRLERAHERLGSNEPRCLHCGEDSVHCLELHHVAGQAMHDDVVTECRNCHRKVTELQKDHPPILSQPPHILEVIGRYLLGIADLFRLLIDRLDEYGRKLIELAAAASSGNAGAQS
jgi:hypothetical protein